MLQRQNIDGDIQENLKNQKQKLLIPIWQNLTKMLKEWKLQSKSPIWIFLGRQGKPMIGGSWERNHWQRIKKEYNLPRDFRFHDLRHTFASIMLSRGAQAGDVQKLLRHASVQTTINIYRHILPSQLEQNFEIINFLYREKNREEKN
jgi:integrase